MNLLEQAKLYATVTDTTEHWQTAQYLISFDGLGQLALFLKHGMSEPSADPTHTINAAKTVAVAIDVYWQPIDTAPRGVKLQLLGKGNVATYGTYYGDKFWTHWCPLPKKPKED